MLVTTAEATVQEDREGDLLAAWEQVTEAGAPPGLLESTLARGPNGAWRIHTVWESRDAVAAMRSSTQTPAAIAMFAAADAEPTITMWDVRGHFRPD
jgi:heme-degrading monooxygenase HmoA